MDNQFQDIVPPEKRTIRNVSKMQTTSLRRPARRTSRFSHIAPQKRTSLRPVRPPRFGLWFIIIASSLVLLFTFSFLFSGAKVIVQPKQHTTFVDAHFEASKESGIGTLVFETMRIEREDALSVAANAEDDVEIKASGKIIIFNNYDGANQRLIKNTRFETPDGLVYRINSSVVVPGRQKKDGEIVPGSIEVTVYADEAGEEYNIGLTDFTIPGFKGSPRFDGFFARSKTPMTEGFVGTKRIVEESVMKDAQKEIQASLEKQLLVEAFAQKPEGFYLFEEALFLEYEALPSVDIDKNEVEIRERAVLYGILFDEVDFAGHIAENTIGSLDNNPVHLEDVDSLNFTILDSSNKRPWEDNSFTFTLEGDVRVVWTFNENKLRNDLLGRSKDALPTILSGYPSIEKAEVVLRPFWQRTFPDKESKIRIEQVFEWAQ